MLLEALENAILDIGQNGNAFQQGISLTEIADVTAPVFSGASINYSQGLIVFNTSEYLDVTPAAEKINISAFVIGNTSSENTLRIVNPANIVEVDGPLMTIQLSETQRYKAVQISGTKGGDHGTVYFKLDNSFVRDIAQVPTRTRFFDR